jgi:hypothetical protein
MQQIITSEKIHAYDYEGNPVEFVPRSQALLNGPCPYCNEWITVKRNRKPENTCPMCKKKFDSSGFEVDSYRAVTTADMKKYGLFPSVTRILRVVGETPIELSTWWKMRFATYVMESYSPNKVQWWDNINKGLAKMEDEYADYGSELHKYINRAMEGIDYEGNDPALIRCIPEIQEWEAEINLRNARREAPRSRPDLGFGGTIDLYGDIDGVTVIADYKTKHTSNFDHIKKTRSRLYLKSAIKQIAACGMLLREADYRAFIINVRAEKGHKDAGEIFVVELTKDELDWGRKVFTACLEAWFADMDYDPRQMHKKSECKTKNEILNLTNE